LDFWQKVETMLKAITISHLSISGSPVRAA
jgi:hypothetical protein